MAETPRYLSLPFPNSPVILDGIHVGFTVGVTLTHDGQTVTQSVDVICGAEQAAALSTGPIAAYTAWSRKALIDHDLVAKANAAMNAKFASMTSSLPE